MKVVFKNTKLVFDSSPERVNLIKGRFQSFDGSWSSPANGYSSSDIYEVQVGTKIKIKNFSTGASCYMIQAFLADKTTNVAASSYGKNETQVADTWYEMTISDPTVKYVVLNTRNEDFTPPHPNNEAIIEGYLDIIDPYAE